MDVYSFSFVQGIGVTTHQKRERRLQEFPGFAFFSYRTSPISSNDCHVSVLFRYSSSINFQEAAKVRWPSLFDGVESSLEDWVVDQMHIVRPVVETGYENLLLVRLLLEIQMPSIRKSSVEGLTVEEILENWSTIKPVIMAEWDEDRDVLIDLFGKVRDEWIDNDLATWIGANRFYPGVADALNPKVKVLKQLQDMLEHEGLTLHFVEDRLATLKNVIKEPELSKWNLYLGDWGYNTLNERDEAATISRIRILQLSDFSKKLK
ncbi:hypothetical protein ACP275_10G104000 [Erythranthe tilingii]